MCVDLNIYVELSHGLLSNTFIYHRWQVSVTWKSLRVCLVSGGGFLYLVVVCILPFGMFFFLIETNSNCGRLNKREKMRDTEKIRFFLQSVMNHEHRVCFHVNFYLYIYILVVSGYENQDWYIPPPSQRVLTGTEELTPEQTKETLNYFREYIFTIFISIHINMYVLCIYIDTLMLCTYRLKHWKVFLFLLFLFTLPQCCCYCCREFLALFNDSR